jgi:hypothetical protein
MKAFASILLHIDRWAFILRCQTGGFIGTRKFEVQTLLNISWHN